jgi:septal ring factor EnvC (AmiA/AmiB activator)
MNQIFLTALLSVFGTLLIGYFIWSIVRLREVITETKTNRKDINLLCGEISQTESNIQNDIRRHNEDTILHLESKIRDVNEFLLSTQNQLDRFEENISKDLDRRFDKLYQKLYTEFPNLKEQ